MTDGERLSPVKARQGLLGRPVLVVLISSLVLVVLAWAILYGIPGL